MTINALNSGAKVWLADLEDANTPLWENVVERPAQPARRDRAAHRLHLARGQGVRPRTTTTATIVVRPRGWHLPEKHILVDGERTSGSLVDFGLYFVHNAKRLAELGGRARTSTCRRWRATSRRGSGTTSSCTRRTRSASRAAPIRATVLIETYPAAFEMEEILYELREHSAGLNAGRWDYMFSRHQDVPHAAAGTSCCPTATRSTMTVPFMRAYTELLVRTCHKRGAHAIGGMAAFIPSKDEEVNEPALAKVRDDKTREAGDGFDGSWVAHPGMVADLHRGLRRRARRPAQPARPHARGRARHRRPAARRRGRRPAQVTEAGLRSNISVGIQYLEAWLRGTGAVGIYNLMEDAATAEISRSQVWQWLHNDVELDDGQTVTRELVERLIDEEMAGIRERSATRRSPTGRWDDAAALFTEMALADDYADFLTLPGLRADAVAGCARPRWTASRRWPTGSAPSWATRR